MRTVGTMIRQRRHELDLTLQQVADTVGCTKGYLSSIENERRESPPSRELLERIERALRLDAGALVSAGAWQSTPHDVRQHVLGLESERHMARRMAALLSRRGVDRMFRSGELRRLVDRFAPADAAKKKQGRSGGNGAPAAAVAESDVSVASPWVLPAQVPLINRVAAGYPKEFTDLQYPARVADEYVSVPDIYDADAFAARVVGDSMEPAYREGDIVVFSPGAATRPGADCFVRLERDAETTFKRVYFEQDSGGRDLIRLQPLNATYPPRTIPREDVAGLYAAVFVIRPVGGMLLP